MQKRRQRCCVNIIITSGAIAVGSEIHFFTIHGNELAFFIIGRVDGVAQVLRPVPYLLTDALGHKDIRTTHARPAITGKEKRTVVNGNERRGLVACSVYCRAGIYR